MDSGTKVFTINGRPAERIIQADQRVQESSSQGHPDHIGHYTDNNFHGTTQQGLEHEGMKQIEMEHGS
jgi:hypothetical protein